MGGLWLEKPKQKTAVGQKKKERVENLQTGRRLIYQRGGGKKREKGNRVRKKDEYLS